jgi:hypothetical protein
MPQAPNLPPNALAASGATQGLSPQNFLLAAADLHQQGQLTSPVPAGADLLEPALRGKPRRKLKVIK